MDHRDQLQRAVTALGNLPVQGLVTTGPAIDPDQIDAPDGVTVVGSAPHREVLAHADVLLTHGGHGTVMKGLVEGVPIVCMPTGRDQPDNAARLVHRGAGVRISKKASPAKISAAVEHVLDDPSFRDAAARLGEQLRAEADSGAALAELEALASPAPTVDDSEDLRPTTAALETVREFINALLGALGVPGGSAPGSPRTQPSGMRTATIPRRKPSRRFGRRVVVLRHELERLLGEL